MTYKMFTFAHLTNCFVLIDSKDSLVKFSVSISLEKADFGIVIIPSHLTTKSNFSLSSESYGGIMNSSLSLSV